MAPKKDELIDLPLDRYNEYLTKVYREMAQYVPPKADVVEIGVRKGQRGVLSRVLIPHRRFRGIDRDRQRILVMPSTGRILADIREYEIEADVVLSTAILHHTAECDIPRVLDNLHAPLLMFTGPNRAVLPDLFGDHLYHVDQQQMCQWLRERDYKVHWQRFGMNEPYAALLFIAFRRGALP